MAEFERNVIRERTLEGLRAARAHGVIFGRRRLLSSEAQKKLVKDYHSGELVSVLAAKYKISCRTVYNYIYRCRANTTAKK
ncbi:hypothetical protein [Jonquetella anthropi]|uniref:hypothetical protein n=1 Tax=Jonquetella anthropi TaxID=428712 RepID=UPI00155A81A7|nr:hypothetical protein [Jonquetella anthropi]